MLGMSAAAACLGCFAECVGQSCGLVIREEDFHVSVLFEADYQPDRAGCRPHPDVGLFTGFRISECQCSYISHRLLGANSSPSGPLREPSGINDASVYPRLL